MDVVPNLFPRVSTDVMMLSPLTLHSSELLRVDLDAEYGAMAKALRLLSGHGCQREAISARSTLLTLAESRNGEIAADARSVLRVAHARKWFSTITPSYQELEHIAEDSLLFYRTQIWRTRIVQVTLTALLFLVMGLGLVSIRGMAPQSILQDPIVLVFLILALFIAVICVAKK